MISRYAPAPSIKLVRLAIAAIVAAALLAAVAMSGGGPATASAAGDASCTKQVVSVVCLGNVTTGPIKVVIGAPEVTIKNIDVNVLNVKIGDVLSHNKVEDVANVTVKVLKNDFGVNVCNVSVIQATLIYKASCSN